LSILKNKEPFKNAAFQVSFVNRPLKIFFFNSSDIPGLSDLEKKADLKKFGSPLQGV
jgi:hypothetical protein